MNTPEVTALSDDDCRDLAVDIQAPGWTCGHDIVRKLLATITERDERARLLEKQCSEYERVALKATRQYAENRPAALKSREVSGDDRDINTIANDLYAALKTLNSANLDGGLNFIRKALNEAAGFRRAKESSREFTDDEKASILMVKESPAEPQDIPMSIDRQEIELLRGALAGILEIGKRGLTNPKYDCYFEFANEVIAGLRPVNTPSAEPVKTTDTNKYNPAPLSQTPLPQEPVKVAGREARMFTAITQWLAVDAPTSINAEATPTVVWSLVNSLLASGILTGRKLDAQRLYNFLRPMHEKAWSLPAMIDAICSPTADIWTEE